jgi:hypothetical protein
LNDADLFPRKFLGFAKPANQNVCVEKVMQLLTLPFSKVLPQMRCVHDIALDLRLTG